MYDLFFTTNEWNIFSTARNAFDGRFGTDSFFFATLQKTFKRWRQHVINTTGITAFSTSPLSLSTGLRCQTQIDRVRSLACFSQNSWSFRWVQQQPITGFSPTKAIKQIAITYQVLNAWHTMQSNYRITCVVSCFALFGIAPIPREWAIPPIK